MFEKIIVKLAVRFDRSLIPYMIIGGQAVLLYGEPRLTRDIDVTLVIGVDRWKEIVDLAPSVKLKLLTKKPEAFIRATCVLPAVEEKSGVRVDFIFSYTPYEKQAIGRANRIKIRDRRINFAAVEDIIIHKIFAGRPQDIDDVRHIIARNPSLDLRYLRRWLRRFESTSGQKDLASGFEALRSAAQP